MLCSLNEDTLQSEKCDFLELNKTLNFSVKEALNILFEYRKSGRNLNETIETILIVIYSLLIGFGVCANLLVCFVVGRKSQMHTPRNLYIVNLSISDMTMCVICMPFTLITILRREWRLGSLLCKLVPTLQGTNIMISIGTITMIALDRYYTIVRRHKQASTRGNVIMCIVSVWLFSIVASLPLAYYQVVESLSFHKVILYDACIEKWPSHNVRIGYTVCILLVQTVIPSTVVSIVHAKIASHLHQHANSQTNEQRARRELIRNKKTTMLLLGVAILFLVSWLPLSLFSLLADILYPPESAPKVSLEKLYLILAVCHIIAMSSAVSNPIVYGWMNANIRFEFLQLCSSRCTNNYLNKITDDHTTTKTVLATSSRKKSGPITMQMKSEKSKSERSMGSPTDIHIDSCML